MKGRKILIVILLLAAPQLSWNAVPKSVDIETVISIEKEDLFEEFALSFYENLNVRELYTHILKIGCLSCRSRREAIMVSQRVFSCYLLRFGNLELSFFRSPPPEEEVAAAATPAPLPRAVRGTAMTLPPVKSTRLSVRV